MAKGVVNPSTPAGFENEIDNSQPQLFGLGVLSVNAVSQTLSNTKSDIDQ